MRAVRLFKCPDCHWRGWLIPSSSPAERPPCLLSTWRRSTSWSKPEQRRAADTSFPAISSCCADIGRIVRRRDLATRFLMVLQVGTLAWGALAFGANYPWAFWPLAVAAVTCGVLGLFFLPSASPRLTCVPVALWLAVIAVAVLLQLAPFPLDALAVVSPRASGLVSQLDILFSTGLASRHAISIAPTATLTALALFVAFGVMTLGVARTVSLTGPRWLAGVIAVLGVVMALVAIIQEPLYAGKIYGFWTPLMPGVSLRSVREQEPLRWLDADGPAALVWTAVRIGDACDEARPARLASTHHLVVFAGSKSNAAARGGGDGDGALARHDDVAVGDPCVRGFGRNRQLVGHPPAAVGIDTDRCGRSTWRLSRCWSLRGRAPTRSRRDSVLPTPTR